MGGDGESDQAFDLKTKFLEAKVSVASCCSAKGLKRTEAIKALVQGGGKIQSVKLGKKVSFAEAVKKGGAGQQGDGPW